MQSTYFDYAAATPLDPRVHAAIQPYETDLFYNPSSPYLAAGRVRSDVDAARAQVAHWLGCRPSQVTFTAGSTEANNLIIHGLLGAYEQPHIVVSAIEHDAILEPAALYNHSYVQPTDQGIITPDAVAAAITDNTVLVSIQYVNNELGTVQPLRKIAARLAEIRTARIAAGNKTPLYFHTDASQAAAYFDIHAARLGVDAMTISAGKLYGPKQVGALYVRAGLTLQPQIRGGGQERALRSGTENVPGIIGLAAALDIAQQARHEEAHRLQGLLQQLQMGISTVVPDAIINGSQKYRAPHILHVTFPGVDNERLMMLLDEAGFQVAVGSACSASKEEPSHVLSAIGLTPAAAQSSIRFSIGRATTLEMVDACAAALARLVPSSRDLA